MEQEGIKSVVEQRIQEAHDKAYQELQSNLQPYHQGQDESLRAIRVSAEALEKTVDRIRRDGTIDRDSLDDVFTEHKATLQGLSGIYETVGRFAGAKSALYEIGQAMGDSTLAGDFSPRIDRLKENLPDPTLWPDLVKRITKKTAEETAKKEYERGLAEGKKINVEAARAAGRTGSGPNLAPSGAGGSPDLNKARRDYAEGRMSNSEAQKLGIV